MGRKKKENSIYNETFIIKEIPLWATIESMPTFQIDKYNKLCEMK